MQTTNSSQSPEIVSRRKFIKLSSLCAGQVILSTSLAGCNSMLKTSNETTLFEFNHGIASGDPLQDGFIIWTRATTATIDGDVSISWEVSENENFSKVVRSGSASVNQSTDFTLKVDIRELKPSKKYYYRFSGSEKTTEIGQCKTLPIGELNEVNFIVCSCANYPAGYFHAYEEASKHKNIDAVLHLGDYLYEYGMGQYATKHAKQIGRELPRGADKEMISLDDYRNRYNLYRTDKSLQKLHAAAAFILIWDDHEIANDTWREGAQNHNLNEGSFAQRKYHAIKAWYEWQPVRVIDPAQKQKIYRSFDFGNLLSLHMLDTRVFARDKQLNVADYVDQSTQKINKKQFNLDLQNKNRVMLGETQFSWLEKGIVDSKARWQLLGQQVLMGRMLFPSGLSKYKKQLQKAPKFLNDLSALQNKIKNDESVNNKTNKFNKYPYNMDAWDGYPHEREKLFSLIKDTNKNLIVVSGDTHNAWKNKLTDNNGVEIGAEFAVQSVSSPGMEKYLKMDSELAQRTANSVTNLLDDLQFCNLHQRGYLTLKITQNEVKADWVFIDNILTKDYKLAQAYSLTHKIDLKSGGKKFRA